jgi:hypothetical protein
VPLLDVGYGSEIFSLRDEGLARELIEMSLWRRGGKDIGEIDLSMFDEAPKSEDIRMKSFNIPITQQLDPRDEKGALLVSFHPQCQGMAIFNYLKL